MACIVDKGLACIVGKGLACIVGKGLSHLPVAGPYLVPGHHGDGSGGSLGHNEVLQAFHRHAMS